MIDGSSGDDTMVGGLGNDTYVVDSTSDVVAESASEGTDLIQASVSYTAADNVENLTLTGSGNINATGNTLANTLTGNLGNNSIDGAAGNDTILAGAGNDTLTGGDGNDEFRMSTGADVVTDFVSGTDKVGIAYGSTYTTEDIDDGANMKITVGTSTMTLNNITEAGFNASTDITVFGTPTPTPSPSPSPSPSPAPAPTPTPTPTPTPSPNPTPNPNPNR